MGIKINKDFEIGDTNTKLKDMIDGTGVQLQGRYNKMCVFKDTHWMPTILVNKGYNKVLGFIELTGGNPEFGIASDGSYAFPFTDGFFYQREYGYRCLDESDLGNYAFHKCNTFTINENYPSARFDLNITSKGRPVFLSFNGDMNALSNGCWAKISILRNGTKITQVIAEANSLSQNIPFNLTYLDCVGAGTYTYTALVERGGNNCNFGEEGNHQAPQFIIFEI